MIDAAAVNAFTAGAFTKQEILEAMIREANARK